MNQKNMSSLSRMLNVLDFFTEQTPTWSAEEIALKLDVSIPTCYRYLKLLVDAGLLQHQTESQYTFGPRILTLDYYVRETDPVLHASTPYLKELVDKTGFDCLLTASYGDKILDTHHERSNNNPLLKYGRGRPRPLFLGASPKILLAYESSRQLRKIFNAHAQDLTQYNLPGDWEGFRAYYLNIKKQGYYFSAGELESHLGAIAVPVLNQDQSGARAALSLVADISRFEVIDIEKMFILLKVAAQNISQNLHQT